MFPHRLHKNFSQGSDAIGFREFFPIMDRVYSPRTTVSSQLQEKLLQIYPKIKVCSSEV